MKVAESPLLTFSPHTRGCSPCRRRYRGSGGVFPAYAGMFRRCARWRRHRYRFPRIRGDVPELTKARKDLSKFSPHTRGCSVRGRDLLGCRLVFPAYAGMFRSLRHSGFGAQRFPRIRGDVPQRKRDRKKSWWFSPHTRGCSFREMCYPVFIGVFPAYAGMFLIDARPGRQWVSFPRIRGDVPACFPLAPA